MSGDLLVMGCCVGCAWRCCYELCGCVNGSSPVGFILSLFYLCSVQMNPLCVVCGYVRLRFVACLLFVTKVTNPYDWSECGR